MNNNNIADLLSHPIFKSKPSYHLKYQDSVSTSNPQGVAELYYNCYDIDYQNCYFLSDNSLFIDWGSSRRPSFLFIQNNNSQLLWYEKKLKLAIRENTTKDADTIVQTLANFCLKDIIRYDYDVSNSNPQHPLAHIHMNYSNEFRLSVYHEWTFEDFILFIMQLYYHNEYINIKNIPTAKLLSSENISKYNYYIRQHV